MPAGGRRGGANSRRDQMNRAGGIGRCAHSGEWGRGRGALPTRYGVLLGLLLYALQFAWRAGAHTLALHDLPTFFAQAASALASRRASAAVASSRRVRPQLPENGSRGDSSLARDLRENAERQNQIQRQQDDNRI